jgi:hypothetical protein
MKVIKCSYIIQLTVIFLISNEEWRCRHVVLSVFLFRYLVFGAGKHFRMIFITPNFRLNATIFVEVNLQQVIPEYIMR